MRHANWHLSRRSVSWSIFRVAGCERRCERTTHMRAMTFYEYGPPSILKLEERSEPTPGPGQVRIHVRACAMNAADWHLLRADPFLVRLALGLSRPKYNVLGCDLSGVVDAVGAGVTRLKVGDEVMGELGSSGWGAFAERICAPETCWRSIPRTSPSRKRIWSSCGIGWRMGPCARSSTGVIRSRRCPRRSPISKTGTPVARLQSRCPERAVERAPRGCQRIRATARVSCFEYFDTVPRPTAGGGLSRYPATGVGAPAAHEGRRAAEGS